MSPPIPLVYTFGNHMHWVDMQWLWGYHVLPGSVRDMLAFCGATGAKGNVNFDGVGYEKMAAEAPEALAELKQAIADGAIEPVGCSYGQPYGLFHGGESNVRQRIFGARTVRRLLGVWPKTFWEEEFDFFPQLPQMLRGCGFENASLYFQWTWHTPEVPKEEVPVVWWEGVDGSRLKCATRNRLNLHQWPEDFQALLDDLASSPPTSSEGTPLVLQWLELMPSPDWMCRSELMIPKLLELKNDERFSVSFATLGEYLAQAQGKLPVRQYGMSDVWHGMSLGKNGDDMRWESVSAERAIVEAEALAAMASLLGRPYAQWDVYPVWELEEAWRELLQAQHHDIDECEGLCGRVGKASYQKATELASRVKELQLLRLGKTFGPNATTESPAGETGAIVPTSVRPWVENPVDTAKFVVDGDRLSYEGVYRFAFDAKGQQVTVFDFQGCDLLDLKRAFEISAHVNGERILKRISDYEQLIARDYVIHLDGLAFSFTPRDDGIHLCLRETAEDGRPDPGMNAGRHMLFPISFPVEKVFADTPYAVDEVQPRPIGLRKYPKGDWMTSPQWFEEVENTIFASRFIDVCDKEGNGLLMDCGRPKCWFRDGNDFRLLLTMYDPWDEDYFDSTIHFIALIPHGPWTHRDRIAATNGMGLESELNDLCRNRCREPAPRGGESWQPIKFESRGSLLTALYRESEDFSGMHVENYAGRGMGYPFILRLVEWNGEPDEVELDIYGTVVQAFKTNLLGQIESEVGADVKDGRSILRVRLGPHEIATLYLDIIEGRKAPRDLDAHRDKWATVHRVER